MENRSEEDHKLSQGKYGPERHQEGLGKPDLCEVDLETEDGQVELVDGLKELEELSMTVGEGDTGLVFLNETKVREVCLHEIEKLKSEASSSYTNETISSLQKENDTLKQRLQELESRHTSMKQEATTLIDENKSLLTAIRLLNNELQTVLKADDVRCSRPDEHPDKKEWQVVGAKNKKEKPKQGKEIRKRTKKNRSLVLETMHRQESL
ncbi:unnamed protein product [Porites lobata]|uniref:Uncharacterized protein n=1 Tax=Porites lobata TaxID=104759 RepID=A0ABN8RKF9_9CNID|nr:unnamed protein product [Porites lobata]